MKHVTFRRNQESGIRNQVFLIFTVCVTLLLLLIYFSAPTASAQSFNNAEGIISVSTSPRLPEPGEEVRLRVSSTVLNLGRSNITWNIDGATQEQGVGETAIQFTAGEIGTATQVVVTAVAPNGDSAREEVIIQPAEVDLFWEADSYVHPFYKGKRLLPQQGEARITADPTVVLAGTVVPKNELIYRWSLNGHIQGSASGYGRFTYNNNASLQNGVIGVEVFARDGARLAFEEIQLPETNTEVLIYKDDPLLGVLFAHALTNPVALEEDEITLHATPYFFSTDSADTRIEYQWQINNRVVNTSAPANVITLRQEGGSGEAQVDLSVDHTGRLFQEASTRTLFELRGGEESATSTEEADQE